MRVNKDFTAMSEDKMLSNFDIGNPGAFLKNNPERLMIFLFPVMTLTLFSVAVVLYWVLHSNPLNLW